MFFWPLVLSVVICSLLLTGAIRRYALRHGHLDNPKERSSHSIPMPRGGGGSIIITFLAGLAGLEIAGTLPIRTFFALLGAGAMVGLIGWLDDGKDVRARYRLLVHFAAAGWALAWLGGLPPLPVFGLELNPGIVANVLAAVYLVWMINLYNFMDGIDGIAGIETLSVCAGAVILYFLSPASDRCVWMLPVLLAAAVTGFLFWNIPNARIFMGDSGSGFLGMVVGVFSIHAAWAWPEMFWGWTILLGSFIIDTTVTLLRRAWRREKVYEAHSSHAYQNAARACGSHLFVSISFGVINLIWLLPMAALVTMGMIDGVIGMIVSYIPLTWIVLRLGAGKKRTAE